MPKVLSKAYGGGGCWRMHQSQEFQYLTCRDTHVFEAIIAARANP
jgi:hypothetical protein